MQTKNLIFFFQNKYVGGLDKNNKKNIKKLTFCQATVTFINQLLKLLENVTSVFLLGPSKMAKSALNVGE